MSQLNKHLSIKGVLELLGTPSKGKRAQETLRRAIRRRERSLGVRILLQDPPSVAIRTTLPLLREHMPELFDRRQEGEKFLREKVAELLDQLAELKQRDSALGARIRELAAEIKDLRGAIGRS